jgi:hypothetical protein
MVAKIRIRNSKAPLCGDPLFGHSRIENGIKCKTHIDKSKRNNIIRCSKHTNRGRIKSGIR